jgi:formylglycine-generating enzyme required for sulfatase activity
MILQKKKLGKVLGLSLAIVFLASCSKDYSPTTGWNYNDPKNGGFQVEPYEEQETGPGLVLIEGGTFVMGRTQQDVMYDWDNQPRRVTVPSFYMDQTEVRNLDYVEYLYWLNRVYSLDYPRIVQKALPDTLVWRDKLAYNEPLTELYLRHPAYRDYPVVGVNWLQARDYAKWRTDRVNEFILIEYGILDHFVQQANDDHFDTDAYLSNKYIGEETNRQLVDLGPNGDTRRPKMEDGILLPRYRLPTEAEWEFAALGLIGNTMYERVVERRLYPWNGHVTRTDMQNNYGDFVANFKRGRGDYMGVAGNLNDAAYITAPVYAYWPNDYGLYNMAGNVSEWVMDVYRPLSYEDFNDLSSFRGNVFKTFVRDNTGSLADKLMYIVYDYEGIKEWLNGDGGYIKTVGRDNLRPEENDLIDKVNEFVDKAIEKNKERKYEEASMEIENAILAIDGAPTTVSIASQLLDGISDFIIAQPGELKKREVTIEENLERRNYRKADNINYLDGDYASTVQNENWSNWQEDNSTDEMYDYTNTSMINDKARVVKGGSWKDYAYWLTPGTRRFLDQRQATDWIGFRCAMTRVGSPIGYY